jgi:hypothetical protein
LAYEEFEDLHIDDQKRLLISVLQLLADNGARTLGNAAADQGISVDELWREVCAEAGLDGCHPWAGYPGRPHSLPPARGGDRPLSDEQLTIASYAPADQLAA